MPHPQRQQVGSVDVEQRGDDRLIDVGVVAACRISYLAADRMLAVSVVAPTRARTWPPIRRGAAQIEPQWSTGE